LFLTSIDKTREIIEIGIKNDVDAYLHGGDFFDSPDISDNIAGIVGEIYKEFPKKVIVIPGNHDIRNNNITSLEQTKLGLLGRLGIVKILNYGDKIIMEKDGQKLQITGSPSDFGINRNKQMFILKEKDSDIDVAVHMAHAMILRGDANFGDYVPINEIQNETKADITLSGDFHLGFETVEYQGKYFVNPGALVRKYSFMEEINRTPQVALITIYDNKQINVDLIPLATAKPGNEVLDRSKIILMREYEAKILEFKQSITTRDSYSIDLLDIMHYLAKQEKLEEEILQEILKRIDESKRILGIVG
jgi:DNA repair exonuclease SbcCD nuclease subunit